MFGAVIALIGEDIITGQFKMTMGIDDWNPAWRWSRC